jgi:hypothetical protein
MSLQSVSGYAKLHGVSKAAAQKWQARGLLRFKDGKVDVEASDQSLAHAGVGRFADTATKQRRAATAPGNLVAAAPVSLPAAMVGDLEEAAAQGDEAARTILDFMTGLSEGRTVPLIEAATIKENALAAIRMIEARKRAGEVVEMADAEGVFFDVFRQHRDAWMNFSSRVGPLMAAELGLPPDRVVEVLTAHVHQHLTDLGEPVDPIRQAGSSEADGQKGVHPAAQA